MLKLKIPTLFESKKPNSTVGSILSIASLGLTALIIYYSCSQFFQSRILIQNNQISLQAISPEILLDLSPQLMLVYEDNHQDLISWTTNFPIKNCTTESSDSFFDYDPEYKTSSSLSYFCFVLTSTEALTITFTKTDNAGNPILLSKEGPSLQIIAKSKKFNSTSYQYEPSLITVMDYFNSERSYIGIDLVIYKIDLSIFEAHYTNFYDLKIVYDKGQIDPSAKYSLTFKVEINVGVYTNLVYSQKITKLLSKTLGLISALFFIMAIVSRPISEFHYLKFILENYITAEELSELRASLGKEDYCVKSNFTFFRYLLQNLPLQTESQKSFELTQDAIYDKISLERIVIQREGIQPILQPTVKFTSSFFKRLDFISEHQILYYKGENTFSNRVSTVMSIIGIAVILSLISFFAKDFVTNSNPTIYYNTRYVCQNGITLEKKLKKSKLADYPFAISIPSEYLGTLQLLLTRPFKLLDEVVCTVEQLQSFDITSSAYYTHLCLNGRDFFDENIFDLDSQFILAFVNIGNPERLKGIQDKLTSEESMQVQKKAEKITKYLFNGDVLTIELHFITTDIDISTDSLYTKKINKLMNTYHHLDVEGKIKVVNGNYLNVGLFFKSIFIDNQKWNLISGDPDESAFVSYWYGISGTLDILEYELNFFINFGTYYFEYTLVYPKALEVITNNSAIITIILVVIRTLHYWIVLSYMKTNLYNEQISSEENLPNNKSLEKKDVITPTEVMLNSIWCCENKQLNRVNKTFLSQFSLSSIISQVPNVETEKSCEMANFNLMFQIENFYTLRKSRVYRTNLGGVLTILIVLIMIPISYFKIDEVVNFKNPIQFTTLMINDDIDHFQYLYSEGYSFPYVIQLNREILEKSEIRQWNFDYNSYLYSDLIKCSVEDLNLFQQNGWRAFDDSNSDFYCGSVSQPLNSTRFWDNFVWSLDDCEIYKNRKGSPLGPDEVLPTSCDLSDISKATINQQGMMTIINDFFNTSDPTYPKISVLREINFTNPIVNKDVIFQFMVATVDTSFITNSNKQDGVIAISQLNDYYYYSYGNIVYNKEFYFYPLKRGINRVVQYKKIDYLLLELLTILNFMMAVCKLFNNFYNNYLLERYLLTSFPKLFNELSQLDEKLNSSEVFKIGKCYSLIKLLVDSPEKTNDLVGSIIQEYTFIRYFLQSVFKQKNKVFKRVQQRIAHLFSVEHLSKSKDDTKFNNYVCKS